VTSVDRIANLAKPTGRRVTRPPRIGDGAKCPSDPKHGPTFVMRSGAEICVHHDHFVNRNDPIRREAD
jgi:hypothetical protein